MLFFLSHKTPKRRQYLISTGLVLLVSLICYALSPYIGYRVVGLILLLTVSLVAVSFEIYPVLLAAALSAFTWDFFFIPPYYTIHVASTEDTILLIMYFIIAMVNAVLTYKIRQIEKVARQRKEKANAVKLYNTLLNSLSHELKTPIATIIAATDNLLQPGNNLAAADTEQLVKEISKASFRLNQQVENLLNMSRIESGFLQPTLNWCDVGETIYEVLRRLEEEPVPQSVQVVIAPQLPLFKLDKGMLAQVLDNLLVNAVRYSDPGAAIRITAEETRDILVIKVEDTGPGFPEKEIPFVFDKFYRLKGTPASGTGLGLSIVKGYTEAMGGSVELQNRTGGGSVFTIRIPAATSSLKTSLHE